MLYFLGLRADELISHTWNAFRKRAGQWWFFVEGKGSRQSHLPIHPQLMQVIKVYRQSLGLESVMPVASEIAPLLLSKKNDQGLGYEQLYNLVKFIAQQAANQFEQGSSEHQKLMKCSPHWLRHLFASHLDRRGTPYHLVQRLLRHAKEDVSKIYIHQDDKQLLEAISVLTMPLTMVSQKIKHNSVCKITLQGDGAQGYLFERFLYVLEHFIFKDTVVNKKCDTLALVETFKQHSKLGQSMVLTYQFKQILGKAEQLLMAKLIEQAADIRLLRVSVAIGFDHLNWPHFAQLRSSILAPPKLYKNPHI